MLSSRGGRTVGGGALSRGHRGGLGREEGRDGSTLTRVNMISASAFRSRRASLLGITLRSLGKGHSALRRRVSLTLRGRHRAGDHGGDSLGGLVCHFGGPTRRVAVGCRS